MSLFNVKMSEQISHICIEMEPASTSVFPIATQVLQVSVGTPFQLLTD